MDYSYNNIRNIYDYVLKAGMLSPPEDVIGCWLLFSSLPRINEFLELGSYIGGGLTVFNQVLKEVNHSQVRFTGVDHLNFIGAKAKQAAGAWYTDHFNRCLTKDELDPLATVQTADEMTLWIAERCRNISQCDINLRSVVSEQHLDSTTYDVIHHDYGDSVEENLATMRRCVPLLNDNGVYIVDDWCTGAPLRTWATVVAQQEKLLFPFMWCKNKVFFAKSPDSGQQIVKRILNNPNCNARLFKTMPGSDYFGKDYVTIRMHWQAIQWS